MKELEQAVWGTKNKKTPGEDGIMVECIKRLPVERRENLRGILNQR